VVGEQDPATGRAAVRQKGLGTGAPTDLWRWWFPQRRLVV